MSTALDRDVELLERSLAYAGGVLAEARGADGHLPTPCAAWDLDHLLAHLADALDAFVEAASGSVPVARPEVPGERAPAALAALRSRSADLLGAWAGARCPGRVRVGDTDLDAGLLVRTAALEVAVHAHDVAVAAGHPRPVPEGLARALLDVARALVAPADRPGRFAAPRSAPDDASYADRLLGYLGRPADWSGHAFAHKPLPEPG